MAFAISGRGTHAFATAVFYAWARRERGRLTTQFFFLETNLLRIFFFVIFYVQPWVITFAISGRWPHAIATAVFYAWARRGRGRLTTQNSPQNKTLADFPFFFYVQPWVMAFAISGKGTHAIATAVFYAWARRGRGRMPAKKTTPVIKKTPADFFFLCTALGNGIRYFGEGYARDCHCGILRVGTEGPWSSGTPLHALRAPVAFGEDSPVLGAGRMATYYDGIQVFTQGSRQ